MGILQGTNILGSVLPFSTDDIYETHRDIFGRGGYRGVSDLNERDSITELRRSNLMLVGVEDNSYNNSTAGRAIYILDIYNLASTSSLLTDNSNWFLLDIGNTGDGWIFPPPPQSSYVGIKGQRSFDDHHLYICVETNFWRRVAIDWFIDGGTAGFGAGTNFLPNGVVPIWETSEWTYDYVVKNVETTSGTNGNLLITFTNNSTKLLNVGGTGDNWILPPPLSSMYTGVKGQRSYDDYYFYVCIEDNLWKRSAYDYFIFSASTSGGGNFFNLPNGVVPIWNSNTLSYDFNKVVEDIYMLSGTNSNLLEILYTNSTTTHILIPQTLNGLTDTLISNATSGQLLTYDSVDNKWKNMFPPNVNWVLPAPLVSSSMGVKGSMSYDENFYYICVETNLWKRINIDYFIFSNSTSGAFNIPYGSVPFYDGTEYDYFFGVKTIVPTIQMGNYGELITYTNGSTTFIPFGTAGSISFGLNDLTDVNIISPTTNDYLRFNGVDWENSPIIFPPNPNNTTAGNGLTMNNNKVELGGLLSHNTTIDGGIYDLNLNSTTGYVKINGLKYPKIDGITGSVITTDGSGNLSLQPSNNIDKYTSLTDLVVNSSTSGVIYTDLFSNNINDMGSTIFLGNELKKGDKITLSLLGYINCTTNGNLTFKVVFGGTDLSISDQFLLTAPKTNRIFEMCFVFTVRSVGVSGSLIGQGFVKWISDGNASTPTNSQLMMLNSQTINTTINNQIYSMVRMDNNFVGNIKITNSFITKNKF